MSNVALIDESCRTYRWVMQAYESVMSKKSMSHVTYVHMCTNSSCLIHMCAMTYEWAMSHTRRSHFAHIDESCHTYEWVMSHSFVARTCLRLSHVTHTNSHVTRKNESRRTHTSESCHTVLSRAPACVWTGCRLPTNESRQPTARDTCLNESYHTDQWVMSHIRKRSAKRMDEPQITAADCPRHLPEWVMSLIWMKHVTHKNASWRTYEWVMSHIRMSHVTHINTSCHTYDWDMPHIRMRQVPHVNEACHTQEWVTCHVMSHVSHIRICTRYVHDSLMCATCLIFPGVMTHSHSWMNHGSHIRKCTRHGLFMFAMCLIFLCVMTHSHSWMNQVSHIRICTRRDSFMCAMCLILPSVMTHSCVMTLSHSWMNHGPHIWMCTRHDQDSFVCHDLFIGVHHVSFIFVWHDCAMTHSCVMIQSYMCVMTRSYLCDTTHSYGVAMTSRLL